MDEILALQAKNPLNSPTKIKEILLQISNVHFENEKFLQKLEDNETRYNEILKEVSALKDEFEVEKQNLDKKIKESEEYNYLLENLKKDKDDLELTVKVLETKCVTLKKTKPSLHDEQLLESGKRKHKLYKELTGIRWNYAAGEDLIEGYITNKKDFLEDISYKGDIDYKNLRDLLWTKIYQSTRNINVNEDSKDNEPINK